MAKIKVSPLASRKAATKKALVKEPTKATPSKNGVKVPRKAATSTSSTMDLKMDGAASAELGKPSKLCTTPECRCGTMGNAEATLRRYIANRDGSPSDYTVDGVRRMSDTIKVGQGPTVHTYQMPRRQRTVESHTGYTSLCHTGEGVEDQLPADAGAPKKRMASVGLAKHKPTAIPDGDLEETDAEQEVYAHYHKREDLYTIMEDAKSKALLEIANLSGTAAAVEAIADDVYSDPHILVDDRQSVLDRTIQKALVAALDIVRSPSQPDNKRHTSMSKVCKDLRKMVEPVTKVADTTAAAAPVTAAPAAAPVRRYSDYECRCGLVDNQEIMSLSDEHHDPIVKVFTMKGCAIVSMDPRQDLAFLSGNGGTAYITMKALVRGTADGSDTQIGLLFIGSKRGFAGVEAATSGWRDAELIDVGFGQCSRVYLLQKT